MTIFSTIRLDCLAQAAASNVQKEIDEAVLAHLKRCFSFLRQTVLPERRRTYRYISLLNSRRTEVSIYLLYPISVRVPCRKRSGGGPGGQGFPLFRSKRAQRTSHGLQNLAAVCCKLVCHLICICQGLL